MKDYVVIDGSQGEGGGQMLRTSLSLSAIYGTELKIEKIRAKRSTPGLKHQHLTCVKAVAQICSAKISGADAGSTELEFVPGAIKGGDYRFDVGTAGSVILVAQTVIPVLLKADGPSTVTITGGTHVPYAPIWEFFAETYLPQLRRMGAHVEAELASYGFYPAAGGVIRLKIQPFDPALMGRRFELTDLGAYKGGKAVGVVSNLPVPIAKDEVYIIANKLANLKLKPEVREVASSGPGNYCYAQLDYEKGSVVFSGIGTYARSRRAVGNEVVSNVREFLSAGKACEKHLADQLLVPLSLFAGYNDEDGLNWKLVLQKETQHYKTNQDVIGKFYN